MPFFVQRLLHSINTANNANAIVAVSV